MTQLESRQSPARCDYRAQHEAALQAGEHTYIDNETGYLVFTQLYHQARGFCCESRCRHCPFGLSPLS